MRDITTTRPPWKDVLARYAPLVLPSAHDALAARLIERAGYPAYQIGGFALVGAMHAVPDLDLEHFGEKADVARKIIGATKLPPLVDADDGYGDVKNVARTVREYERMGAAAIFIEDQTAPKQCGHMSGKHVVPPEVMEQKVRAAAGIRSNPDFFILARTDAIEPEGVDAAIRRAERYLKAGADGVYVEGPRNREELEKVGSALRSVPLATSILEGGGKTPFTTPDELHRMGYSMILYPTTLLFQAVRTMELALTTLKAGQPMPPERSVDMKDFEDIVDMQHWAEIEKRYGGKSGPGGRRWRKTPLNKVLWADT